MSTASVLQHYANSGHGQKLLKTKAHVVGRFLLRPDEDFNAAVARQLVDKAKRRHTKVTTEFRLFDAGVQLGDHGVFASMPIEFIKYHRLADWTALTNEPSTLIICVKDYEQRCVTVMRLKDAVTVKVVTDVMLKHKAAYMEEFGKSSELGSTLRRSANQYGGSGPVRATNTASGSRDQTDHSNGRRRQTAAKKYVEVETKEASMQFLQDTATIAVDEVEPDYAVIRRRQIGGPPRPPPPPPPTSLDQRAQAPSGGRSGGAFFTRITVPAGPSYHQMEEQQRQDADEDLEQQLWQQRRHQNEQELHQQYQQRRSQLTALQSGNAAAVESYDDLEMAAVFETLDGPPTMLNEPARYVTRVARNGAAAAEQETSWRLAEPGHYYRSSSTASFGGRAGGHFRSSQQHAVAQ